MWYWVIAPVIAAWVFFDARSRRMGSKSALCWAIGTVLFAIVVVPFYFAKRRLKPGEVREGGTGWNVAKVLAICWTVMVAAVALVASATNSESSPGAALGMTLFIVIWAIISAGILAIGLLLKKSTIVERGEPT